MSQFLREVRGKIPPHDWELLLTITPHLKKLIRANVKSANEETTIRVGTLLMAAQVMLPQGFYARWLHGEINLQLRKASAYQRAARQAGKSVMSIHEMLPAKP